ncbi:HEPN domain-containing protein [Ursidibacter arcticus]
MNINEKIGKFRHNVIVSSEYTSLSESDERAANILANAGNYRQACYFILQAMEKSVRAKIFTFVNPNNEYFREENKSHSLERAVESLINFGKDEFVQIQIRQQITQFCLGETKYSLIHNNLRYPVYSKKFDSYSMLDVNKADYDDLKNRLVKLRDFLKDIDTLLR